MEEVNVEMTLLGQQLGEGVWVGEFLLIPELMTLGEGQDFVWRGLRALAEGFFRGMPPGAWWQRTAGGEVEVFSLELDIAPSKTSEAWRDPVMVEFFGVKWKRPEGKWVAYVPAVGAAAVAEKAGELEEAVEQEIRFAIGRGGRSEQVGPAGVTLRQVAMLGRVEAMQLEKTELMLPVKSPKARARESGQAEKEKSVLEQATTDMRNSGAARAYELEDEVEKIAQALTGRSARSVLLIGTPGVGKTAAVRELVRSREALGLGDRPFWETSGSRLVMGALGYGMWQERCHKLCREAAQTRSIVYLGNLIELVEVGKSELNAIGIAGQLRGYMQRGELLAIAECTPEQVSVLEREDPQLLAAFRHIVMEEPSPARGRRILEKVALELTGGEPRKRGKDLEWLPVLATGALEEMERLHRRYATYSAFPGRPIRFLRNLVRDNEGNKDKYEHGKTIGVREVTAAFAQETGLPLMLLDESLPLEAEETRGWFNARVLAQEEAAGYVADMLTAVKATLNRPRRPIASLLFIGPTGVGKTEMAKALAEFLFSDRGRLTRFDMSEFQTAAGVTRLVGGFGAEGLLTAKVRQQPFSVVLLDEVEKAHESLFDLLLQVLGEGRLTDAAGRVADFSNSVVIMTSNLGAASFGRGGFGLKRGKSVNAGEHFVEEVRSFLRPELFNRIDRIVPFMPLDSDAIGRVARREVDLVKGRDGLKLREVGLELEEGAVKQMAQHGFDAAYGARPLKRAIERELLTPLADALNEYAAGVALKAVVREEGEALKVRVRAADGETKAKIDGVGPEMPTQAMIVRRMIQRLEKSGAMRQVENEVYQLDRNIERAEARGKLNHPQLPHWRERLKRVKAPAEEVKKLMEEAVAREEQMLLLLYERRDVETRRDWAREIQLLSDRLTNLLMALFALRFANPDQVSIAVFSDKGARVLELARAYMHVAKARGFEVLLGWYKKEARGLVRYREQSAAEYLAKADGNALGIVLEVRGKMAAPLFYGEAGWHCFEQQGKKVYCEVITGECAMADLETPRDVHGMPATPDSGIRRTIDLSKRTVSDAWIEWQKQWGRLEEIVKQMIESLLRKWIMEPVMEEED